jgi:predicted MFS family arabinose efflux permease
MATARSLWTRVAGPELAPTAHALNAALADGAVLLSPPLVGALSGLLSASAAMAALLGGATVAGGLITWTGLRLARPMAPRGRRGSHRVWGVLHESDGLRTLVACDALIGGWIGAFEVAATAIAARSGAPALAALPLSASAAGSLVVSLWSGSARVRQPASRRYLGGCVVVALAFPLMLLAPSVLGLAVVAVAVGAGFALLNVAAFHLLDHVVAPDRAVEAFTWLTTGSAVGMALGAACAGQLARAGELAGLGLSSCCAVAAAGVAGVRRRTLHDPRA